MAAVLQSASRDALAEAGDHLDARVDGSSAADLKQLGDDLFAVLRLLTTEIGLRRSLADPTTPGAARSGLADRLLNGKISRSALDVVNDLVSARWSRTGDLLEGVEVLARRATLGVAEKDSTLDDVEDQLFRFGRILDREPQLSSLLADQSTPADKRVALLHTVLGGKVSPVAETLLEQTVRIPRGRNLQVAAEELSELAAARRDRYVAHVRTPVRLTAEQEQRLTDSLTRLYNRPISLQVELDPSLLGGLVVQVGGELIDGSVSSKLATARRKLPS
ncbi:MULTISPECIES: F0F1 ATP synthase subunit delta [unclassified Pseudonocardia]|jgi:F-type H+-transporting ATPase subunit delta|uniref:F0F1 ATP synthase subunit delta n=1 Tax=unclassified Pseudonocardia TaxID=2619320 RepID=UPI000968159A|nr:MULTISPECIES: F0F1 ATP synthase subunit delta [unclassified Pseudonocardia]MBN9097373.1 F0F1 ATP synthase subunit delta [Pseudonocardia sp.]OJY48925.1 MAG: F0F1 ATP synthase subunit delta [Pseudonocardia sp. 73-21]